MGSCAQSAERFVGRIGALAVALGLGAAIATSPGVAWADETAKTPDPNVGGTTTDQQKTTDSPGETNSESEGAEEADSQDGGSPTQVDGASSHRTVLNELRKVIVRWSGGPHTSRFGSRSGDNELEKPDVATDLEPTGRDDTTDVDSAGPTELSPAAADHQTPLRTNQRRAFADLLPSRLADRPELPRPAKAVIATLTVDVPQQAVSRAAGPNLRTTSVDRNTTLTQQITTAISQPDASAAAVPSNPVAALLAIPASIARVATGLVGAVLNPLLAPSTPRPVQTPILWAVLGWVRRQLFNQRPDITLVRVDDAETSDPLRRILVDVDAEDPENDPLTYSATNGSNGTVTLNDDGSSFTYTPDEDFTGKDTFTVSVADTGGLFTALTGRPHVRQQTVTVYAGDQATTTIGVGKNPWDVEVGPNGKVYVTNLGSGSISVIDTANNNMVKTITVGGSPTDIAYNSTTQKMWVTDSETNRIIVIDTTNDAVLAPIQTTFKPSLVVFTSDGQRAVVYESFEDGNGATVPALEAFSATTGTQRGIFSGLDGLPPLGGMAAVPNPATPGIRDIIVSIPGRDEVQYLDSAKFDINPFDGAPIAGIGIEPLTIAFGNTLNAPVYMVADIGGFVTKVDSRTNRPIDRTYDVGTQARNIKIVGNYAYVTSAESNRLTIIDTTLYNKVVTIDDAGFEGPIGIGVVGDRVYVANASSNTVTVVRFQPS